MTLPELLERLPEIDRAAGFTVRAEHLSGLLNVLSSIETDVSEHHDSGRAREAWADEYLSFESFISVGDGFSLFQYLIERRMELGAKLLRKTDEKIQSIAFRCGYKYQNDFAERFRKRFGMSPTEYREGCNWFDRFGLCFINKDGMV